RERMAPIVAPAGNDDGAFSDPATPPRLPARAALLGFAGVSLVLLTPLALWLRRGPQPPPLEPQDTATRCEALIEDRPRLQGEGPAPPRPAAAPKPRAEHVAALYNQAELYRLRGQLEQAERLHQCILQLREALLGAHHPDTVESVVSLGLFYYDERHDHERAEPLLRRGLEALNQTLGPSPPKLLRVLNALARIAMLKYEAAQAKGEGAQAEAELQRADELTARALTIRPLGQKVATLRADALDELDTLARLYRDRGDFARADALDGRAKALREAEARPDMVPVAGGTVRLGAFDAASRPAECAALTPDDDCTEATHPERSRTLEVSAFFLDAREVTNEDFAFWLDESAKGWHLGGERQGTVQTNDDPPRPLAHAGDACEGGLVVAPPTPDGSVPPEARIADDARKAELAPDATEPRSARIVVRRGYERRPVVCVTWQGASDYCRAQGKRLPTEAEWELAAKGARSRPFPWGAERPRPEGVAFGGLAYALAGPRDVTTSARDRTPEGVFDLGGNVAEWTQSGAGADRRVARGGSWASANLCHVLGSSCAFRPPTTYASDLGVRCARATAKTLGFR
nr:SUMF1/EgtB/PvdO family nonheme iron enzyme [Polyangiaceae bacterium]